MGWWSGRSIRRIATPALRPRPRSARPRRVSDSPPSNRINLLHPPLQRLEEWWDECLLMKPSPFASRKRADTPRGRCHAVFERAREEVKAENQERRRRRSSLKARQKAEVRRVCAEIMESRRSEALRLPVSQRRRYYHWVSVDVRPRILSGLEEDHRRERSELRPLLSPRWNSFVEEQARRGNVDARLVLGIQRPPVETPSPGGAHVQETEVAPCPAVAVSSTEVGNGAL